jgi:E3 ubiquitin-protein ligase UHRF1
MALKKSSETKKPVRVIRGYKLKSDFAPSEGYRYDGLYTVEKAWMEKGLNPKGYLVCKFAFVRIAGQPRIPERNTELQGEISNGQDVLESTSDDGETSTTA